MTKTGQYEGTGVLPGPWLARGPVVQSPAPDRLAKASVFLSVRNARWTVADAVGRFLAFDSELELEAVVVDDASTDGTWDALVHLVGEDSRVRAIRHHEPRGPGACLRTAMAHMTGDVAFIIQEGQSLDAHDLSALVAPVLEGRAEAAFGSRFVGDERPVMSVFAAFAERAAIHIGSILVGARLTDRLDRPKAIRAEVLKHLALRATSDAINAELVCRLVQSQAGIREVAIQHDRAPRRRPLRRRVASVLSTVGHALRCRLLDSQFTPHAGCYILTAVAKADRYNRWLLEQVRPYLGARLYEAGAGIGNLSALLLDRERLILAERDPLYLARLAGRFEHRPNVRVIGTDLTRKEDLAACADERVDTVFCSNVLEHIEGDEAVLAGFAELLMPGGHCILVVPAGSWLYSGIDDALGHFRRYEPDELREKVMAAGLEVVFERRFSRLGTLGWAISGKLLRRRTLSPRQMIWFDRLMPVARLLEHVLPVPGMSLVIVGRKPTRSAVRQAA